MVLGIALLLRFILSWNYLPWIAIPLLLASLVLSAVKLEYGLMWFVFLIPLLASLPLILGVPNFYLIEIVFWAVILIWVFRLILQKEIKFIRTPLNLPLAVFLIIIFGSCAATLIKINQPFSGLSYGTLPGTLHKIFLLDRTKNIPNLYTLRYSLTIFEGIFLYFFLINTIKSKELAQRLANIMILSGVVVAGYGIFQYLTRFHLRLHWVRANPNLTRVNATLQDPNSLGSYLILVIPLTFYLFLVTKGKKRFLLGPTILGLGLCLIFTASRGA